MIKLYYSPGACSLAPHIALEEAGAEFEAVRVAIADGDHKKPEFLAINPRGFVPALDLDGTIIVENIAIQAAIATRYPEAGLIPFGDAVATGRCFQIMSFLAATLHIAFAQFWRAERFTEDVSAHPAIIEGGRARIVSGFGEIDARLRDSHYLAGDSYTVADAYAFVFFRWGNRIGIDMTAYPGWMAHSERLLDRPAIQRTLEREGLPRSAFLPGGG